MQVDKEYLCKSNGTQAGPELKSNAHNIENNNPLTNYSRATSVITQNSSEVSNSGQQSLNESQSQALKIPTPNG